MFAPSEKRSYRGGGRGRGFNGRGGGRGGAGGWDATWGSNQQQQQSAPVAVWGGGGRRSPSPAEEDGAMGAPVGRSMSDVDAMHWFKENNGQNYGRLKELTGSLISGAGGKASVYIRRVQSDPFAPGSQMTVRVQFDASQYHHNKPIRRVAFEDLVHRTIHRVVSLDPLIEMAPPSQHVLERSGVRCVDGAIEIHVRAKLPGQGRRIEGKACASIIQRLVAAGLGLDNLRSPDVFRHLDAVEDQEWLRDQLAAKGLIAFIPDDAVLPRSSGRSDMPLMHNNVPFKSPSAYAMSFTLPCRGKVITGMGIKRGVTVIVGGGFHGKSTLLRALEVGVYNKIPGDGREYVVVDPTAVKIRSEDRRAITGVNISPFINNIPMGRSTKAFVTADASGSTSQAANIVEALELGSTTLLIDEDTSATNFMARDPYMRMLVPDSMEPITPLVERIRGLYDAEGVSTILVAGGSSAFLAVADTVMQLDQYRVCDLTATAKALPLPPMATPPRASPPPTYKSARVVEMAMSMKVLAGDRPKCSGLGNALGVRLGEEVVDLDKVEQLVEQGQCNGVAMAMAWMQRNVPGETTVPECIDGALKAMASNSLEVPGTAYYAARGFVTMPRRFEVGAALNRLRTLAVKQLVK